LAANGPAAERIMSRRRRRKSTQTRFDVPPRPVLIVSAIVLGIAVIGLSALMAYLHWPRLMLALAGGGYSRAAADPPRNMDIWAVNPDDTLRFVTVFYPGPAAQAVDQELVTVAGPLVRQAEDVTSVEVFGGGVQSEEYRRGPGTDSALIYDLYALMRDGSPAYGLDATFQSAPYLSRDGVVRILSLGAEVQEFYRQVIVAVAFPEGTAIRAFPDMHPYRRAIVQGWLVFYFDTTALPEGGVIRVRYVPGPSAEPFDPEAIDAAR
jgi:hypothetical protein